MDRKIDLAGALGFATFGLMAIYVAARLDPTENLVDPLTARGMPLAVGIFILVLSLVVAVRQAMQLSRGEGRFATPEGKTDLPGHPSSFRRVLLVWITALLYAALMPYIGYLIASFIGVGVLLWLMEVRTVLLVAVVAGVYSVVSWALFAVALDVNLPSVLF